MIDKYFFIPASNKKFIANIDIIKSDKFVFDFEDAIGINDRNSGLENLKNLEIKTNHWVRYPFTDLDESFLNTFIVLGVKNFILPKLRDAEDFEKVLRSFKDPTQFNFVILIENPRMLFNISQLLNDFQGIIKGIGLGSHDYTNEMNMQHDLDNLFFARNLLLNVAKANKIEAIDIASMELTDEEKLKAEFISAVRMGFDAKFFIHPRQIELFNRTKFFSDAEISEAIEIKSILKDQTDYTAFKFKGKIYEKPHLRRIDNIVKWAEEYERIESR